MNKPDGQTFNEQVIAEFRANGGEVGGPLEGATLLLLHTTGAKSKLPRINPVDCTILDEGLAVYASAGGTTRTPDWFYNVVANPRVRVELGTETFDAVARVADGKERTELLERHMGRMPEIGRASCRERV